MDVILHLLINYIKHFRKIVFLSLVLLEQRLDKDDRMEMLDLYSFMSGIIIICGEWAHVY